VSDTEGADGRRDEHQVTPLELFFDLVFVFAITQVTSLLANDPTWGGVLRGMLVLTAIWWAWTGYAWLTSAVDVDEGGVRLTMLAAMAAMLFVALAVPGAFGEDAVLFGVAYLVVRLLHVLLSAIVSRDDPDLRMSLLRVGPIEVIAASLLVLAGFLDGPDRIELVPGVLAAAALGMVVVAALWWLYFDVAALIARRRFTEMRGVERARVAVVAYSYLHLAMVAGIVLFALGLKTTLDHVGVELDTVPAVALCGGTALYLLGHVAFLFRTTGYVFRRRTVGAVVLVALVPVAVAVPALAALALVSAVCAGVVAYEALRYRDARVSIRHPELAG
jgi:low temperature requirement protein LtrA